ncbi:MAG TPA: methyltransferase domain-containing protein [Gaiellales bacterium]|nr:methyltransferase domain-containing protein [Gaiellales bacterium]
MTARLGFGSFAEHYDRVLVPAMFAPLADAVAAAVEAAPGDRVLDVACGTGALTRVLAQRVAPGGEVVGVDVAEGMLEVARAHGGDATYLQGSADALPVDDGRFTIVTCQQGLQFTDDPSAALRGFTRVLASGGRIAVACWTELDQDAGFLALAEAADEHLGPDAGRMVRAPFRLADPAELRRRFEAAGIGDVVIEIERVVARVAVAPGDFAEAVMAAGPAGAAYAGAAAAVREAFAADVARRLQPHADGNGVSFEMPSLIAVARV